MLNGKRKNQRKEGDYMCGGDRYIQILVQQTLTQITFYQRKRERETETDDNWGLEGGICF